MEVPKSNYSPNAIGEKTAMTDLALMRRAATIAANTQCWIGLGCVIAKNGHVLAESWNKTLDGEEYCQKFRELSKKDGPSRKDRPLEANVGCVRHDLGLSQGKEIEKCCSIHAEALAISECAKKGISTTSATLYVTSFPCLICLRSIIAAGIKKIFYMNDFYKPHHIEMLQKNGMMVKQILEKDVWTT